MPDPRDIYRQVARLHAVGIDQGFLTSLGEGFLSLMYEAIDTCPESVLLTEIEDGQVLGFVAGASSMGPIYKQMLRQAPRLALTLAPVLLNPRKVWRIMELLRHSRQAGSETATDLPRFELLSIAVAPEARRRGLAARLYERLAAHAAAQGLDGFRIVVGEQLAPAHRFYVKMGAKPKAEITVHGTDKSVVYVSNS